MENTRLPERIRKYLKDRGLSEQIIDTRLDWNGTHIVIPIYDGDGRILFRKMRRDPDTDGWSDAPKYLYEKGATAALYGVDFLSVNSIVFLCEGELDALRLMSEGLCALSTTGGSGTFLDEWADLLKGREVVVCYDNDEAGIKGAIRVQAQLPTARILTLPRGDQQASEGNIKDVTDYLKHHSIESFLTLANEAHTYILPKEPEGVIESKKQIKDLVAAYRMTAEQCVLALRDARMSFRGDYELLEQLRRHVLARYDHFQHLLKSFDRSGVKDSSRIMRAKAVSILQFITFNRQGFGKCLWHDDSKPSLFYNKDGSKFPNTVKCFSCGYKGDAIDVVMKIRGCTFKEAIDNLLGV